MSALSSFAYYLSLYLSIALIGGSIVHMPINPVRFSIIGVIGLAMFAVASYVEVQRKRKSGDLSMSIGHYLGLSFALSLGLGMLSGAIQHYLDAPQYASILIPLGFILAFTSYGIREKHLNPQTDKLIIAATITAALLIGAGLFYIAPILEHLRHDHTH